MNPLFFPLEKYYQQEYHMKKNIRFFCVGLVFVAALSLASLSFAQTNAEANTRFERVVQPQRLDFIPYDLRVEYLR